MTGVELRAEEVRWDLSDLAPGAGEARAQWSELGERAADFASRYRGRIAALGPAELRALLDEADELEQELSRLAIYTHLRLGMDAADAEANDLATVSRDRGAEIENALVFLGLEWIALDDEPAEALLAAPELAPFAHKLRVEREEKPYVLSEPEEQALNTRRPTVSAWQALHDRHVATLEIPFDAGEGEQPHTISTLLSYLYRPDRGLRVAAQSAFLEGLEPRADVLAACYDALVGDRLGLDRLRGFADPMQPTNMSNELDGETVEAMMRATEESYEIGRRWFRAKARCSASSGSSWPTSTRPSARRARSRGRRPWRSSTPRSGGSRRGSQRSSARASTPGTWTRRRVPARRPAPTAPWSRRASSRTCC